MFNHTKHSRACMNWYNFNLRIMRFENTKYFICKSLSHKWNRYSSGAYKRRDSYEPRLLGFVSQMKLILFCYTSLFQNDCNTAYCQQEHYHCRQMSHSITCLRCRILVYVYKFHRIYRFAVFCNACVCFQTSI